MIPSLVKDWLTQNGYGEVVAVSPVGGGCINNGMRLDSSLGEKFFLKVNAHALVDMFE
jgi:fructosamine-3-kinase